MAKTTHSVHAARSVFFGSINDACTPTRETKHRARVAKVRENRIAKVAEYCKVIGHGVRFDKEGKPTDKRLNAAQTVQQVLLLNNVVAALRKAGEKIDFAAIVAGIEYPEGIMPLAGRFPWAQARDSILGWSKEVDADLNEIAMAFGLLEENERIVPSEPAPAEETAVEEPASTEKPVERKRSRRNRAA